LSELLTTCQNLIIPEIAGGGSLPDQSGHTDEFLKTDGSAADWAPVPGGAIEGPFEEVSFAWGDAPTVIYGAGANKTIYSIQIIISVAFNGTNPDITIGDAGDNDRLFIGAKVDPATVGTYEVYPNYAYGAPADVLYYITPGAGASAGSGRILIQHQG
jgi:hypothetical protein